MAIELPLLERASSHQFTLLVHGDSRLIPDRRPRPGEQYRFHFDMTKCIGCKCCVVACNEQNGNPGHLNWRRVGEIEGGIFPHAQRWHLSMGCNHCLEPSCLKGCPVEAYTKDPLTGIVDHNADTCIGCQYCTWNCSYGVPQFNQDRGVVGKCDMCHGRLNQGLAPACVNACPEGAIAIEILKVADWVNDLAAANAPGLPSAEDSYSTTRITMPSQALGTLARVDGHRLKPQHADWSLVFLLVLTQMSVGAFATLCALELTGVSLSKWAALIPLLVAMISLSAAPLHLGRPIYAYRAIRNWRNSWLSREIIALSLFAGAAAMYGAARFLELPHTKLIGVAAVTTGILGIYCSSRIYIVPARPSWYSYRTFSDFLFTTAALGPLLAAASGVVSGAAINITILAAIGAQLLQQAARYRWMSISDVEERRFSLILLKGALRRVFQLRFLCPVLAALFLGVSPQISLAFALAGEFASRWLFFTSAVPKTVASSFLGSKGVALEVEANLRAGQP